MSITAITASALVNIYADVKIQDSIVADIQVSLDSAKLKASDYRIGAAVATHKAVNVDRSATTTQVAAESKTRKNEIPEDICYTSNTMVGYFATAGWVLSLEGDMPANGTVLRLSMDIKEIGQKVAKPIIMRDGQTTTVAYREIRKLAQVIIDKREAEAAAKTATEKSDSDLLTAALATITAAVKLDATDTGKATADAIVKALLARYSVTATGKLSSVA